MNPVRCLGVWQWITEPNFRRIHQGCPPGGPFDPDSARLVRLLSHEADQILEISSTAVGVVAEFMASKEMSVSAAGGGGWLVCERGRWELPARVQVNANEKFWLEANGVGLRWYLGFGPAGSDLRIAKRFTKQLIYIIPGELWSEPILDADFIVETQMSREGIRLSGLLEGPKELAFSRPCEMGAVQWTPSGQLLIHGPDGPTTGGYAAAGWVPRISFAGLAQLRPGQSLQFAPISREAAQELGRQKEIEWKEFKAKLQLTGRI